MTYDLTRLGNGRFEHLVQALALNYLGHGVDIFGAGPDGGREATFNGEVNMEGKGTWNGYGVIQAKYKERLSTTTADQKWFFEQVTAELDAWIDTSKTRRKHQPMYFIIATNVPLTAVSENGGLDRLKALFEQFRDKMDDSRPPRPIGMPEFVDYDVWHAEYLDRLLETNEEVSRRYADLILPGDVIARLYDHVTQDDERLVRAWINYVRTSLTSDTKIELGESGDLVNTPLELAEIAVDLPVSTRANGNETHYALQTLVNTADQILSPALHPAGHDRLIVLGGPGSGKSTLSRLLCQIYRVALLQKAAAGRVTAQVAGIASQIRTAFDVDCLPTPSLHRLPIRVVLSTFADELTQTKTLTLLQHIVSLLNHRASDHIRVNEIARLIKQWPVLVVLDGMDEVASADNRGAVTACIKDFLSEMAAMQADLLIVCTSRPVGFEHDDEIDYEELHLMPLPPRDAIHYADRLLASRFQGDPDRQEETLQRLRKAATNGETARMMTSPLQVTILSLLLEQRKRAPASRYALFKAYYDVIYARECNKPGGNGAILELYRPQLDELHQSCGLAIHARAERAGKAESILPIEDLEAIARRILEAEEHRNLDALVTQLLRLARERLVLLVPRMAGVAFEVRTLAEFFAARSVMAREDSADRLQMLVTSAHWRNTWLLAAGHIFSERRELRDSVVSRLHDSDHSSAVNRLVMPGSILAIDALEDGFASATPVYEKKLAIAALKLVTGPIGSHINRLAHELVPMMEQSDDLALAVWREINALMADHSAGALRTLLVSLQAISSGSIGARATNLLEQLVESAPQRAYERTTDESIVAIVRAALVQAGVLAPDQADGLDPTVLLGDLRKSYDGSPSTQWVFQVREIAVELCRDYRQRSRLRATLATAIEHDFVGDALISL
ncbi:hypothetical protein R3P93_14030 [Rhodococcus cerastii]|uniref:AAA+ ATPase domain-containing protein n=1 Tax=Rhodococcus cerastii TaxID=908616 RepID=A0ABU4D1S7_9NOCA|nr:hypothetical protein [Rhodococcus cerastii]MDV6303678.1 hypothetical protein [Rhodococcus cerastii]